jgi:hypothetical protein
MIKKDSQESNNFSKLKNINSIEVINSTFYCPLGCGKLEEKDNCLFTHFKDNNCKKIRLLKNKTYSSCIYNAYHIIKTDLLEEHYKHCAYNCKFYVIITFLNNIDDELSEDECELEDSDNLFYILLKNYLNQIKESDSEYNKDNNSQVENYVSDPDSDYSRRVNKKLSEESFCESNSTLNYNYSKKAENKFRLKKANKIKELYDPENIDTFIKDTNKYNELFYDD